MGSGYFFKSFDRTPFRATGLNRDRISHIEGCISFVFLISKEEIHAFSVHPACLRLGQDGSSISLTSPKPLLSVYRKKARLYLICPVRALRRYMSWTQQIRKTNQLFVCYSESVRGKPVSKQRLAKWLVRLLEVAYHSAGKW